MPPVSLMQSAPAPRTVIDGVEYLYFGGTGYLGLASHPEVIEAGCAALRAYGVHSATSRSRIGTSPPVQETEQRAAGFFGTEDAFYFGSGYAANHILVQALAGDADLIAVDAAAHYCVLEAARLPGLPVRTFRPGSAGNLAEVLAGSSRPLVMSDAVNPSTGALAPVEAHLEVLASFPSAILLLDDAHGFGVLGENGRGTLEEAGLWPLVNGGPRLQDRIRLAVGGTLAKALGGFGGIIPGTREFVSKARASSHYFDGASAPASAVAGSSAKALEILCRDPGLRSRLRRNVSLFHEGLRSLGISFSRSATAVTGISLGSAEFMRNLHHQLKECGIMVPYIGAYSGIPPEGVLRFAIFANHTREQIGHLLSTLRRLLPSS